MKRKGCIFMSESSSANCAYRYTVKRGDSFYLIAHRLGVSLRDLLDANPSIPPARLMVGDVLCIPYGEDVGVALTTQAFSSVYGQWVSVVLALALCVFAIATAFAAASPSPPPFPCCGALFSVFRSM